MKELKFEDIENPKAIVDLKIIGNGGYSLNSDCLFNTNLGTIRIRKPEALEIIYTFWDAWGFSYKEPISLYDLEDMINAKIEKEKNMIIERG